MTGIQNNKELIRSLYTEALNKRNMTLLAALVSPGFTGAGGLKGVKGFEVPVLALIAAFPDVQWNLEELIGEGDKVYVRWVITGTHTASYQGIPATGKAVSGEGAAVYELKDGKVTGARVQTDRLGFLQQLEVLPANPAALRAPGAVRFVDRFAVPEKAKEAFMQKMKDNRDLIKTLKGFVADEVYARNDDDGHIVVMTIAVWENMEALDKAREAVQAAYRKIGFDPAAFCREQHITMERGIFHALQ